MNTPLADFVHVFKVHRYKATKVGEFGEHFPMQCIGAAEQIQTICHGGHLPKTIKIDQ